MLLTEQNFCKRSRPVCSYDGLADLGEIPLTRSGTQCLEVTYDNVRSPEYIAQHHVTMDQTTGGARI